MIVTRREIAFFKHCVEWYGQTSALPIKGSEGLGVEGQQAHSAAKNEAGIILPTSEEVIDDLQAMIDNLQSQLDWLKAEEREKNSRKEMIEKSLREDAQVKAFESGFRGAVWQPLTEVKDTAGAITILSNSAQIQSTIRVGDNELAVDGWTVTIDEKWPYAKIKTDAREKFYAELVRKSPISGDIVVVPSTQLGRDLIIVTNNDQSTLYCSCYEKICGFCNACHHCDRGVLCDKRP